ncbi:restriction endonuclease subunit S [Streptococcus sobrinus]|uniref:Type I restriction modification DNA specificity domain protein n=6 Tax=Streptococcus sobrinus TaxID=1310 RepID=U2IYY1_9STRE|nr:restriction endonuclease subunit S [Streptococcus sobrinus]ERJ79186.1 type I restriction modification DNA specificity domain protein [Streptococcus sobrinus W1703]OZV23459.1 restriction endonuclease subunit S [Streptococcus sobrinus]
MTKQKIPNIRFKNYTDAWEQRKLGEVADIIGGGTPSTSNSEYWDGEIDWYSPVEIGDKIFVDGSQKKITSLGLKKSSAKVLPVGSVLFTSRAGIGNTAILAKEGTTNQGFQSIVPHENKLNSYFIFSRTHELKRYGEVNGAGSTFVEVSGKQMSKMPILIPKIDEQVQIGSFFQSLDNLIALHQRKLEDLKSFKATMLSKMFPKHGQTVPEIRLAGFDGEWKTDKLKNRMNISAGGDIDKSRIKTIDKYPVVANALTNKGIVGYYDDYKVKAPAVTVTGRGDVGHAIARHTSFTPIVRLLSLQSNDFDVDFLENMINSIRIYNESTGVPQLTAPQLGNYYIQFPSLDEQCVLGTFFSNLDNLTSSTQSKIGELKTLKKKLLQEMFV